MNNAYLLEDILKFEILWSLGPGDDDDDDDDFDDSWDDDDEDF